MNKISNLSILKYFLDAATSQSVAVSARKNFVSQSAVSQGIKKLEEQLGVELIRHQKKIFQLTSEGELLLSRGQEIFDRLLEIESLVGNQSRVIAGSLRVATSQSLAVRFVSQSLGELKAKHPSVVPQVSLGPTEFVQGAVKDGKAEIGIAVHKGNLAQIESESLFRGKFCLIAARGSKVNLASSTFLVTETRNEVQEFVATYKEQFKKPPEIGMVVHSWSVIRSFVENKLGIGLVPDFIVAESKKVQVIKGMNMPEYTVAAYFKRKKQLSRQAIAFLEVFKKRGA